MKTAAAERDLISLRASVDFAGIQQQEAALSDHVFPAAALQTPLALLNKADHQIIMEMLGKRPDGSPEMAGPDPETAIHHDRPPLSLQTFFRHDVQAEERFPSSLRSPFSSAIVPSSGPGGLQNMRVPLQSGSAKKRAMAGQRQRRSSTSLPKRAMVFT